ncbi:MAG: nuclear transport factor 2 family protein [Kordiimonadaceae bacterium]|nr:nuclear transport factor 2 family protein [Kordiimonadaceae bacterium]
MSLRASQAPFEGAENSSLLDKELSPDFAAVSDTLYVALRSGDADTVAKLMVDDVLILEGGQAQTSKAEYMGGHMILDMAFLKNMNSKQVSRKTGQAGDLAWVITHTEVTGIYKGKPVDTTSREFLQLKRIDGEWKITMVQWGAN